MHNYDWNIWSQQHVENLIERGWAGPDMKGNTQPETLEVWKKYIIGKSVLDVGCGVGHAANAVKDDMEYLGIDFSETMIKVCKERFPHRKFNLGDVYQLEKIGQYDTVISFSVLIHLPDVLKGLKTLWTHAKQRLIFSIQVGNRTRGVRVKDKLMVRNKATRLDVGKYLILQQVDEATLHEYIAQLPNAKVMEQFKLPNKNTVVVLDRICDE